MALIRPLLRPVAVALLASLPLAGPALARDVTDPDLPRQLAPEGPVSVSWSDPAQFSELRHSRNRFEARRGDWVRGIARHLARRAAERLGPGERLEVEITDIKLAGDFEPGRGHHADARVVRDIYPPRIALRFTLRDARGQVAASGERVLSDPGFLHRGGGTVGMGDALRHEKRLVDDWLRRELPRGGA